MSFIAYHNIVNNAIYKNNPSCVVMGMNKEYWDRSSFHGVKRVNIICIIVEVVFLVGDVVGCIIFERVKNKRRKQ